MVPLWWRCHADEQDNRRFWTPFQQAAESIRPSVQAPCIEITVCSTSENSFSSSKANFKSTICSVNCCKTRDCCKNGKCGPKRWCSKILDRQLCQLEDAPRMLFNWEAGNNCLVQCSKTTQDQRPWTSSPLLQDHFQVNRPEAQVSRKARIYSTSLKAISFCFA